MWAIRTAGCYVSGILFYSETEATNYAKELSKKQRSFFWAQEIDEETAKSLRGSYND